MLLVTKRSSSDGELTVTAERALGTLLRWSGFPGCRALPPAKVKLVPLIVKTEMDGHASKLDVGSGSFRQLAGGGFVPLFITNRNCPLASRAMASARSASSWVSLALEGRLNTVGVPGADRLPSEFTL